MDKIPTTKKYISQMLTKKKLKKSQFSRAKLQQKKSYFLNVNLKRSKKLGSTLVKHEPWTS